MRNPHKGRLIYGVRKLNGQTLGAYFELEKKQKDPEKLFSIFVFKGDNRENGIRKGTINYAEKKVPVNFVYFRFLNASDLADINDH